MKITVLDLFNLNISRGYNHVIKIKISFFLLKINRGSLAR
jgi:hypothetical protein